MSCKEAILINFKMEEDFGKDIAEVIYDIQIYDTPTFSLLEPRYPDLINLNRKMIWEKMNPKLMEWNKKNFYFTANDIFPSKDRETRITIARDEFLEFVKAYLRGEDPDYTFYHAVQWDMTPAYTNGYESSEDYYGERYDGEITLKLSKPGRYSGHTLDMILKGESKKISVYVPSW